MMNGPAEERMKHLNVRVEGSVQGVGFRWWARSRAALLGVRGFVRNEDDGSVYLEIEGQDEAVDRYLELIRQGPASAVVRRVTAAEAGSRSFSAFEIEF